MVRFRKVAVGGSIVRRGRLGAAFVSVGLAGLVGGVTFAPNAVAAIADQDFAFTGAAQSYHVPAGICSASVVAIGASGGRAGLPGGSGALTGQAGLGGMVSADISVTPGSSLTVLVGGQGAPGSEPEAGPNPTTAGGFNGGGNGGGSDAPNTVNGSGGAGGGASSVLAGSTPLVVAGGGGGVGGWQTVSPDLGNGGNAGFPSAAPGTAGFEAGNTPGRGGTQAAGGAGGTNDGGSGSGQAGTIGQGGDGSEGGTTYQVGGGGGGGGYFGGGGGGAARPDHGTASGGGGGSSFGPPSASFVVYPSPGNGAVSIFYDPATDTCATSSPTTAATTGTASSPASGGTPSAVEAVPAFTG